MKPKPKPKPNKTVHLDPHNHRRVKRIAMDFDTSIERLVNTIIASWFAARGKP